MVKKRRRKENFIIRRHSGWYQTRLQETQHKKQVGGGAAAVVGKMEPVGTVARQVGTYMKTLDLSQPHYSRVFTDDTGTQTAAEMQQQYISGPSQPFPFVAQCAVLQGKTAPEMFELIG